MTFLIHFTLSKITIKILLEQGNALMSFTLKNIYYYQFTNTIYILYYLKTIHNIKIY